MPLATRTAETAGMLAFCATVALTFTVVAMIGLLGQEEPPQRHPAACICPQHRGTWKGRRRAA